MRFDTRLVHAGQPPTAGSADLIPPIHVATTYDRFGQDERRYFYGRGENPTREAFEDCLAALDGGRHATAFASGQAAAAAVLALLAPGQYLACSDDVYGGTHALFAETARAGVRVDPLDLSGPGGAAAIRDLPVDPAMVWIESPTNPLLKITDLAAVGRAAHERGALVVVDNTLAGPALQQPLAAGADIVLYSTSKSLAGHLDVIGGALVYSDSALHDRLRAYRTVFGNVPGPFDCHLAHRGVKTLALRVARQCDNAAELARALQAEPAVERVIYPGLPAHPEHELAARQMQRPGSLLSFTYRADPEKLMRRVQLFAPAVSLGGVRSLIECPALMTHRPVPRVTRLRLGITDNLIRVSAGIEDPADLIDDLLAAVRSG
ncbi:PLP-dependent aspartate aminotransferase family protein [Micromonospora sp. NPDC007271]|uniref:trans-sulfuration enzyme family protein n=1 Tax=Micromonospora sp. NPDC007271 TaxID=3154587 RepID=UPI0033E2FE9A